jgi:glycosyltransferase involved in cell wall biosynthesis
MKERAPVAVIIPVYNRRLKLIATLRSVVAQSKLPAILIVVDDGSTDGTAEAAKDWLSVNAPFEWKVVRLETNAGVSVARNVGLSHIGDLPFVCFLDSDDLWPAKFIAEGLRALEGKENAVAAVADRATKSGRRKAKKFQRLPAIEVNPLLWVICNDGGILSCTMIRSSAARAAGPFPPGMLASEDTDFLLRLFLLGGAAYSKAGAVVFIKNAPLEPTEPLNLSSTSPDLKYLWTHHLTYSVLSLPKPLLKEHGHLIRTAVACRWADAALVNRRARNHAHALHCLLKAIWWDYRWGRRLKLVWWFGRRSKEIADHYPTPLRSVWRADLAPAHRNLETSLKKMAPSSANATNQF